MNVLEELIEFEDQIDRAHVERRVLDWERRLQELYTTLEAWLPAGWSAERRRDIRMDEPLMQKFGVAERQLPELRLICDGALGATVQPRGLWIVGANGRVDLLRAGDRYVIIDAAENLDPPHWTVAPFFTRQSREDLSRSWFARVLA